MAKKWQIRRCGVVVERGGKAKMTVSYDDLRALDKNSQLERGLTYELGYVDDADFVSIAKLVTTNRAQKSQQVARLLDGYLERQESICDDDVADFLTKLKNEDAHEAIGWRGESAVKAAVAKRLFSFVKDELAKQVEDYLSQTTVVMDCTNRLVTYAETVARTRRHLLERMACATVWSSSSFGTVARLAEHEAQAHWIRVYIPRLLSPVAHHCEAHSIAYTFTDGLGDD